MSEKIVTYPPAGKDVFLRHDLDPRVVAAENEEIGKQRTHKGMSEAGPKVGLAFSGGGIRSATFGLGVLEALKESKAKNIAICNLMTKWGETHDFVCSDMIKELLQYSGLKKFDHVICNTQIMSPKLASAYEQEKKYPMKCDVALNNYAEEVITGDFFSEADIARHDSEKIARIISEL